MYHARACTSWCIYWTLLKGWVDDQVPMADARKKELDFFRSSPHYSALKNVGTGFLSSKLSTCIFHA